MQHTIMSIPPNILNYFDQMLLGKKKECDGIPVEFRRYEKLDTIPYYITDYNGISEELLGAEDYPDAMQYIQSFGNNRPTVLSREDIDASVEMLLKGFR